MKSPRSTDEETNGVRNSSFHILYIYRYSVRHSFVPYPGVLGIIEIYRYQKSSTWLRYHTFYTLFHDVICITNRDADFVHRDQRTLVLRTDQQERIIELLFCYRMVFHHGRSDHKISRPHVGTHIYVQITCTVVPYSPYQSNNTWEDGKKGYYCLPIHHVILPQTRRPSIRSRTKTRGRNSTPAASRLRVAARVSKAASVIRLLRPRVSASAHPRPRQRGGLDRKASIIAVHPAPRQDAVAELHAGGFLRRRQLEIPPRFR